MEWVLAARPPFLLEAVVESHGWIQLVPFTRVEGGGFRYVLQLVSGQVVELLVETALGGVRAVIEGDLSAGEEAQAVQVVTWMVGLDQDFAAFYELARQEPKLAGAEARARGRVLRSATLIEDVVKTILTTNTSWAGTKRMVERLVTLYGAPLSADPARRAFPTAARLAGLDEAALRSDAKLGFRAPSVLALAQRVAGGELDLEALKAGTLPTEELRRLLLGIRGVGDYAAANLLMLLGRYDYVPVDSWARMLVAREWHGGQAIGRPEVEAAFASWGQYQGLAYWFWDWGT
jgi:3-methyladenine DNA glycosylase/8-oxoguanine DNA glycosylase